jgi:hypothetical protein
MDRDKPPHQLDYEKKRRLPPWNVIGFGGIVIYALAVVWIELLADPENVGDYIALCTIVLLVALIVWAGIKYGTQKKDFWF